MKNKIGAVTEQRSQDLKALEYAKKNEKQKKIIYNRIGNTWIGKSV